MLSSCLYLVASTIGTIRCMSPKVFSREFRGVSYKYEVSSYDMFIL